MATSIVFTSALPEKLAVGVASAQFSHVLEEGIDYEIVSTTDCHVKVGADPATASNATGSQYVKAGVPYPIAKQGGSDRVAIIRDAADGSAWLSKVGTVR